VTEDTARTASCVNAATTVAGLQLLSTTGFTVRVGGFNKDEEKQIEKALAPEMLKKM
jgi:hypothetical protein